MNLTAKLVDTHAHLADDIYLGRLDEVLQAADQAGVSQILAVATTLADSISVIEIARQHAGVFAAVGIHPNNAAEAQPMARDQIESLARDPAVRAIGETGLDRHWNRTPFDLQQEYFGWHLELAHGLDLPVIIHSRDCHQDIIQQLVALGRPVRGVLHSFTGSWAEAQELLDCGLHLSFAGMITFANKSLDPLREAASLVPIDRLLVETDSPYLSPHPHRGRPNEPALVALTAGKLANLRGISLQELAEATTCNARTLFKLPL